MPELQQPIVDLTDDTLFSGELICRQHRDGYRFSVDAVLAAHFAVPKPGQRVLDLGCGCGVIGLILAHRQPRVVVSSLEMQEDLAALAEENGRLNGFADRFQVIRGDVRAIARLLAPESFDLVICNPPYRKKDSGRINQGDQAALARHELSGEIVDFVRAAAFAVKNRGKVVFVYPARRSNTLLAALHEQRLTPKRLQPVYSYPCAESARLVLVEAVKNGGEQIEILAPLYIYERKNGDYAPTMQALYEEEQCWPK
ncbi:methyltransferase [uncultured Desulfobulbus sp.]|uniref:tRNA1(Val) (adenine(37)-N6)-methyltransferase n=1 Tax=uncultured Desulfobulbus sp. TaxID=239745 RepID=UPI0029C8E36D|nr:methyltransferase [uncultured Desulfobulbus sp.]